MTTWWPYARLAFAVLAAAAVIAQLAQTMTNAFATCCPFTCKSRATPSTRLRTARKCGHS